MFSLHDREILRRLAGRIREISELPIMQERRRQWTALNDLRSERPMILVSPEGSWKEIDQTIELTCDDSDARMQELAFQRTLYRYECLGDDSVISPYHICGCHFTSSGYGVELKDASTGIEGGAIKHIPPITDLSEGLKRLRHQTLTVDHAAIAREIEYVNDLFGDLLSPRPATGYGYWTTGPTITAIALIGLEGLMMAMVDEPDNLKALMQFLSDDMKSCLHQLEFAGALGRNADADLIGSGNLGFVSDLPSLDRPAEGAVPLNQLWGLSESQETIGVSPEMFAEFIWPYQKPLMELFGLTYYGCCEPVENRFQWIRHAKNLRCISVSPWSNVETCAELYGRNYVLCRKPNPSLIASRFEEDTIRQDIRHTLDVAGNLNLVFVLKDTHTVNHQPQRFKQWTDIVHQEIEKF